MAGIEVSGISSSSRSASRVDKPARAAAAQSSGNVRACPSSGSPSSRTAEGTVRCRARFSNSRQPSNGSSAAVSRLIAAGGSRRPAMKCRSEVPGCTVGLILGCCVRRDGADSASMSLAGASHRARSADACRPRGFRSPMIPPRFQWCELYCEGSAPGCASPSCKQVSAAAARLIQD
ncbi:hypothetical protein D3C72_1633380 [compost metagenome]